MKKCKNIECNKEIKSNRIYCSFSCRNIYVNKYLRDYSNYERSKIDKIRKDYKDNPKYCFSCNSKIPYYKRKNTFCNHSCKAKYINTTRKLVNRKAYSEQAIKNLREANRKSKGGDINYEQNPSKCSRCNKDLVYQKRNYKYCSRECIRENPKDLKNYRVSCRFKFSLNDYPEEFDFNLIKENGWYSPTNKNNNLTGVSRDHMFSVRNGFELAIDPNIIGHPANCRLMLHTDNFKKKDKSSIFISELIRRINKWDIKYKGD